MQRTHFPAALRTVLLGLACAATAFGAKPVSCTNISTKLDILTYSPNGTYNAIRGDGSPYIDGAGGVTAKINVCEGTGNLALQLSPTRHTIIDFSAKLAAAPVDTTYDDPFTGSVDCFGLNVCWSFTFRNLLCLGVDSTGTPYCPARNTEYEFTTHVSGYGPLYGKLSMFNPGATIPLPTDMFTVLANNPYANSLVKVRHCPADAGATATAPCAAGEPETWYVWSEEVPKPIPGQVALPDSAKYVASLILNGWTGKPKGPINGGEFSIPFYFRFTAQ